MENDQPSTKTVQLFLHFDPPSINENKVRFAHSSSVEFNSLDTNGVDQLLMIKGKILGTNTLANYCLVWSQWKALEPGAYCPQSRGDESYYLRHKVQCALTPGKYFVQVKMCVNLQKMFVLSI